ncbi:MAG: acyltransferase [Steroidobacteraceae bacterium]
MKKILPLESLRGLAALVVVLHHSHAQIWRAVDSPSWLVNNPLVSNASYMVDLFFVLSGFVIALNYAERIKTWDDAWSFQVKRFWRLYPLRLVMLLVFAAIECLKLFWANNESPAFMHNDGEAFVNNLLLTQSLYLPDTTFNYPAWSISTEFYAYAVFGLLVLLGRFFIPAAISIVLIAGAILLLPPDYQVMFPRCLYAFFIGVLAYKAHGRTPTLPALPMLIASVVGVCLAHDAWRVVLPLLFALTILSLAASNGTRTYRALSAPWLVFLGTISYSVYMTHAAVWWLARQIVLRGHIRLNAWTETLVILVGVAVVLGVSVVSYKLIEDRFRKGLRVQNWPALN